jgi:hypothetical protein
MMIPERDLGRLLEAREKARETREGREVPGVLVEDVDLEKEEEEEEEEVYGEEEVQMGIGEGAEERGRSMMKVDSRERNEVVTPRA